MDKSDRDVGFHEIAPAIEFVCWIVVLLLPLLRLINGAAVTNDQFVIQVSLFLLAAISVVGLRIYDLFR